MADDLLLRQRQGRVTTLVINRPERRNALSGELLSRLEQEFVTLGNDASTLVVVLRGAGEDAFCAGMDLSGEAGGELQERLRKATEAISSCACATIAMIYGYALGAGFDLAMSCDFRIADDSAKIGLNPVRLGIIYDYRSILRIMGTIGAQATRELLLTGAFLDAQRGADLGLLSRVVPKDQVSSAVRELAETIGENAPLALRGTKSIIVKLLSQIRLDPQDQEFMQGLIAGAWASHDAEEGRRAFREKRKPKWTGS